MLGQRVRSSEAYTIVPAKPRAAIDTKRGQSQCCFFPLDAAPSPSAPFMLLAVAAVVAGLLVGEETPPLEVEDVGGLVCEETP